MRLPWGYNLRRIIANYLINRLLLWTVGGDYRTLVGLEHILEEVRKLRLSKEGT